MATRGQREGGAAVTRRTFHQSSRTSAGVGSRGCTHTVAPINRKTTIPSHLFRAWFFCVVRLCPCLFATADVSVHLISVAIIVQLVRGQGCWAVGDTHWRAQLPGSAGRPADGSGRTCWSWIWTFRSETVVYWKSW